MSNSTAPGKRAKSNPSASALASASASASASARAPVPRLEAGPALDRQIAIRVFEFQPEASGDGWFDPATEEAVTLLPYSRDVAAAWRIVDHITEHGYRLRLEGSKIWKAQFYKSAAHTLETHEFGGTGSTAAEAICLAAITLRGAQTSGA